jgi:hypothetical protein
MTKTAGREDYGDREVGERICRTCQRAFEPDPMGYNGLYCSDACKQKSRYRRETDTPEKKAARRAYMKAYVNHRRKNDPEFKAKADAQWVAHQKKVREWLANYKLEHGCADCGFKGHFAALQLDHEGVKSVEISKARTSIARLQAEIAAGKCVVRCANCHSIRTWQQKQKGKDA